eukprot:Hpha_TRINITY_DN21237_c0_g1::TRINITY_DN21237_c0_g1_i1::g.171604::m.171604
MPASKCWECWKEFDNTTNGTTGRMCPEERPYRSGSTFGCGCMESWHGKVCSADRCCRVAHECYGNSCNQLTQTVIIVTLVLVGFISGIAICFCVRNRKRRAGRSNEAPCKESLAPSALDNVSISERDIGVKV